MCLIARDENVCKLLELNLLSNINHPGPDQIQLIQNV